MKSASRLLALAAVLAAIPVPPALALDPHRSVSQYVVNRWGTASLPSATVHALLQTKDGYLWLGTGAGLVRFDGARFVSFSGNAPQLVDGGVSRLAGGADGRLYLGTTMGTVLQYSHGVFSRLAVPAGGSAASALFAARDGALWVAMPGRPLQEWKDGTARSLFGQIGGEVPQAIVEDARGDLWMGSARDGLLRYREGGFTTHRVLHDTVQALHVDRSGATWIGTPHGLHRWDGGRLASFTARDGLAHENVTAILEDRDRNLWIGTAGGGLSRLQGRRFTGLTASQGLSDNDVRCLLEDREGNLWVGTADGLSALSDGRFTTYGGLEGLADPAVRSVVEGADGAIWAGTTSAGLARIGEGTVVHHRLPRGMGKDAVLLLFASRDGSLWISVENGRLFRLAHGVVTEHTPYDLPHEGKVTAMAEDASGPLFFISRLGQLARIRNRRLVPLHPRSPHFGYAHAIHRDSQGTLWIGTSHGLVRARAGEYKLFTTGAGPSADRVRWVTGEPDGTLWLATGEGLARFENGTIRRLTIADGLPESYLRAILDDGKGYLWVVSMGRFFRLAKREVLDFFAGRAARVTPLLFDSSDGLRTTETLLSNSPAVRARDGRLWFATARGVSVVDPARIRTDTPAPDVRIESVSVDGRTGPPPAEGYRPGRGAVSIEYTVLSFGAPSRIRFRYRLDGFDDDWIDAGTRRAADYSTLPPGWYRFSVVASNRDGQRNGRPATLAFSIRPPFYRRSWFYVLTGFLALALAAGGHRYRLSQLRARYAAVAAERERIAREWHDSLAQSIAGAGIQLQAILDRLSEPGVVRHHAELAWRIVQSSLEQVRASIWALRSGNIEQGGLCAAVRETVRFITQGTSVTGMVEADPGAGRAHPDVEWNALRIVQEAVTNAVRHAAPARVDVRLAREGDRLRLRVQDDGCGFDSEAALGAGEHHFGLLGMQERALAVGGMLRIDSTPGQGTAVTAELPVSGRRGQSAAGAGDAR